MQYAFVMDVPAPVEFYDAVHAEVVRRSGGEVSGLLLHVGRATATGFQVIEVWESRDQWQRYNDELVEPVVTELSGGQLPPQPPVEEFDVRGLVIPRAPVLV